MPSAGESSQSEVEEGEDEHLPSAGESSQSEVEEGEESDCEDEGPSARELLCLQKQLESCSVAADQQVRKRPVIALLPHIGSALAFVSSKSRPLDPL